MLTLENHFVNIEVKLQDIEEGLESALKLLDTWILKQQPEEQSQPQFDEYTEISSLDTESELLEDMCLATLFRENEGDIDAFADRSLDALSAEDDSNIGEFGGLVFDLLSIENGNKVLTTSLNSEEVHSDEDKLVKTRNKKNIEVGTVELLMHSQFSPSRFLEDHEVDFNLLVLEEYSKVGREIAAPYMFDQLSERNGMSRNSMNSDHVPLASWYPILAGYFDVNSCNDFMLEYEIMILDKYERIRFQGVKNTINSKICDVYSRLSWKEVLSWKVGPDTILSKITASYNLWLNLESDKKTGSCEEIRKSIFLTIEEIPKLIAEQGAKVWVENKKCNQLFHLFRYFAPSLRRTIPTVEGTASSRQNGRPFEVINSLGQRYEYGENGFYFDGSLNVAGNRYFRSGLKKTRSAINHEKYGNEQFLTEISKWVFHERGHLKAVNARHHKAGLSREVTKQWHKS